MSLEFTKIVEGDRQQIRAVCLSVRFETITSAKSYSAKPNFSALNFFQDLSTIHTKSNIKVTASDMKK